MKAVRVFFLVAVAIGCLAGPVFALTNCAPSFTTVQAADIAAHGALIAKCNALAHAVDAGHIAAFDKCMAEGGAPVKASP